MVALRLGVRVRKVQEKVPPQEHVPTTRDLRVRQGAHVPLPLPRLHLQGLPENAHGRAHQDETQNHDCRIQRMIHRSDLLNKHL